MKNSVALVWDLQSFNKASGKRMHCIEYNLMMSYPKVVFLQVYSAPRNSSFSWFIQNEGVPLLGHISYYIKETHSDSLVDFHQKFWQFSILKVEVGWAGNIL